MFMSKERLVAFTDAVLAIIMTILVLELEKPAELTWSGIWDLRMNFFAYTISFFWLGTMWVNMHRVWDYVEKVNNRLVWISMLLLFFSSLFPYVTSLVSESFDNTVAQVIYGIVVMLVSFMNVWMYKELSTMITSSQTGISLGRYNRWMVWDISIKIVGLIFSLTVYPPAMMWAVLFAGIVIILPQSI